LRETNLYKFTLTMVSELSLTGARLPVRGILPIALRARAGHKTDIPVDIIAQAAVSGGYPRRTKQLKNQVDVPASLRHNSIHVCQSLF
jgi:hypothetical protein